MDSVRFREIRQQFSAVCDSILEEKGLTYSQEAVTNDRLGNLKRSATHYGCSPFQVAGIFMQKHMDSVQTWIREASKAHRKGEVLPNRVGGEPIVQRLADLRNYVDLLFALVAEEWEPSLAPEEVP